MLVSKLVDGLFIVQHGTSRRAFRPKFVHRLLLAWVFRNFISLPVSVLAKWQKTLIVAVMADGLFVPVPPENSAAIIGTVESATTPPVNGQSAGAAFQETGQSGKATVADSDPRKLDACIANGSRTALRFIAHF
jgi:hypothetical protein